MNIREKLREPITVLVGACLIPVTIMGIGVWVAIHYSGNNNPDFSNSPITHKPNPTEVAVRRYVRAVCRVGGVGMFGEFVIGGVVLSLNEVRFRKDARLPDSMTISIINHKGEREIREVHCKDNK